MKICNIPLAGMLVLTLALLQLWPVHGLALENPTNQINGSIDGTVQSNATAIVSGEAFTCVLSFAGGVKCWGKNDLGQLGEGTLQEQNQPVDVTGLTMDVLQITAGAAHACALTAAGGVKCRGNNVNGQLGDGTNTARSEPVDVSGLASGVAAISAGDQHTCALTTTGDIQCWGWNIHGELGDGTGVSSPLPVNVIGLAGEFTAISARGFHSCAITVLGGSKCWGLNTSGELGDGTGVTHYRPADVSGLTSDTINISAGKDHTCALVTGGGVKCWGNDLFGQLGNGGNANEYSPVDVLGLNSGIIMISAGSQYTCALNGSSLVLCWGLNATGQLGNGTVKPSNLAVPVTGIKSFTRYIMAGYDHTCALTRWGGVYCWGANDYAQTGDGMFGAFQLKPVNVVDLAENIVSISMGSEHSCAFSYLGDVKCWGRNNSYQLGDGTNIDRRLPVDVFGLAGGVVQISSGYNHTYALTNAGAVKCWGDNSHCQLGNGTNTTPFVPADVLGLSIGVYAIAAGGYHSCALLTNGVMKCWGSNGSGQLGDGTEKESWIPVEVAGLKGTVTAILACGFHTCAVTSTDGMMCWGANDAGQLGNGTIDHSDAPLNVIGLTSGIVADNSAGDQSTCAITTTGETRFWGWNYSGQIGDGTYANQLSPVGVIGLSQATSAIGAGGRSTCAVKYGQVLCWGDNSNGQLGDGTWNAQITPQMVNGLAGDATAVSVSRGYTWSYANAHTCALLSNGSVQCWGDNTYGELGDGSAIMHTAPVQAVGFADQSLSIYIPLTLR